MNEDDIFYPVPGYERIMITKSGIVKRLKFSVVNVNGFTRNHKEKILGQFLSDTGYYCVGFRYEGRIIRMKVHRLLAMAFIPNLDNLPCVNHINAIRSDNRIFNLEWCDFSYNNQHKFNIGYITHLRKLQRDDIVYIYNNTKMDSHGYDRKGSLSISEMSEKYKVSSVTIGKILRGVVYSEIVNSLPQISIIRK